MKNPNQVMRKRKLKSLASGLVFSGLGTLGVFLLILSMNNPVEEDNSEKGERSVAFDVTPPKPPPAPKKVAKKKPSRVKKSARPKAQAPSIQSTLSGASFNLPAFEGNGFDAGVDDMLGEGITDKDLVMNANSVDQPPRPSHGNSPPRYPRKAVKQGITGTVVLKLMVTSSGKPKDIRVIKASPPGIFDDAALQAVRSWLFEPATYQGRAVNMEATLPIHFEQG